MGMTLQFRPNGSRPMLTHSDSNPVAIYDSQSTSGMDGVPRPTMGAANCCTCEDAEVVECADTELHFSDHGAP